jgi:hypothetical protein
MTDSQVAVGVIASIILVILIVKFALALRRKRKRKEAVARRVQDLVSQFGTWTAERILKNEIWQGMTRKMLLEAMGEPVDVDQNILKSKKKETWKYGWEGANRFKLQVFLENDVVVGWKTHQETPRTEQPKQRRKRTKRKPSFLAAVGKGMKARR